VGPPLACDLAALCLPVAPVKRSSAGGRARRPAPFCFARQPAHARMHAFVSAALRGRACQGASCTVTSAAPGGLARPARLLAHERGAAGAERARAAAQANAACLSTSGKLLTEKVDVMRLTFYIAPITAVFILPMLLHLEVRAALTQLCRPRSSRQQGACACQLRRTGMTGTARSRAPRSARAEGQAYTPQQAIPWRTCAVCRAGQHAAASA